MMGSGGTMGLSGMMGISLSNPYAVTDSLMSQALTGGVDVTDVTMMGVASDAFSYASQALAVSPLASVTDPTEFITLMYEDMLGRAPTSTDISYWTGFLDSAGGSRSAMITYMASSAEASTHVTMMGWMSGWLTGTSTVTGISTADAVRTMEVVMAHGVFGSVNGSALTMMGAAGSGLAYAESALAASPLSSLTNSDQFIGLMYETMLGRAASSSDLTYWDNFLGTHNNDRGAAMMYISASPEAQSHAVTLGWVNQSSGGTGSANGVALTSTTLVAESLMAHALNGTVGATDVAMMGAYNSPTAYAQAALQASPYATVTDTTTFVTDMYHAMLGRDPSATDVSYWDSYVAANGGNRAMALVGIANAPEALTHAEVMGWV